MKSIKDSCWNEAIGIDLKRFASSSAFESHSINSFSFLFTSFGTVDFNSPPIFNNKRMHFDFEVINHGSSCPDKSLSQ